MTDLAEPARPAAPPRRRDAGATRAAILEAARNAFAVTGYDRTSLRDIAALAGSDVALIPRYFGGKEGLFTEALKATKPRPQSLPLVGCMAHNRGRLAWPMSKSLVWSAKGLC